jgi:probable rRNA maturation factor
VPDAAIDFFVEELDFSLQHQNELREWIRQIIEDHGYDVENLTYVFCSDDYLHQINLEYLDHDSYTDIVTFNNSDFPDRIIEGDIFISVDRVRENAETLFVSFTNELHRVIIHGVLHLLGYDDKDAASQADMREKEDSCLSLRNFL